jgi:phosphate acetyltransferase
VTSIDPPRILFVAPTSSDFEFAAISFGLVDLLRAHGLEVGYVKPVGDPEAHAEENGRSSSFARKLFGLMVPEPIKLTQAEEMVRRGRSETLLEEVVGLVDDVCAGKDVVIVEGMALAAGHALLADIELAMARSLSAEVIAVVSGRSGNLASVINEAADVVHRFSPACAGVIVVHLPERQIESLRASSLAAPLLAILPEDSGLAAPRLSDVVCDLNVTVAHRGALADARIRDVVVALKLGEFDRRVRADDLSRMERLIAHAGDHFDFAKLSAKPRRAAKSFMSPPMFRHQLIRAAREADRRIVLPEGDEPRTLAAAADCARRGIARCVLLGEPSIVRNAASRCGVQLPDEIEIIDPAAIRADYVAPMVELRKSKKLTPDQALALLEDTVVLGTMMLAEGHVDGLVSGAVHTTASTVRPALQLIRTAPSTSLVSSVFFMLMPDQVLAFGDCAINPDPTAPELAEIAIQSADSAVAFGIEPRVAMISYSAGSSGSGGDVDKVREATRLVREHRPDLPVDGPIQFDAASVESMGRQKAPESPVAGRANVLVFPDLNTGNTTYKAVQRSANVVSIGPMLQGLRKPVNDLSRGASVDDIIYTIAITAVQAAAGNAPKFGVWRIPSIELRP